MKIKVQKRDNFGVEYKIKIPESPANKYKTQFMMTGMTCTLTDKSKMEFHDKTNTKTVEKSMNNSSPLGALSKSIVGNSPITRTMYGIPFIRENDSGLHVHALISESGMNTTKYGNGRERLESIVLSMKKKSELDNASPRGKRS